MNILFTDSNTFLLSTKGKLYSWGAHSHTLGRKIKTKEEARVPGEVIVYGKKLLSIACGSKHVLALDVDGKVYSWGKNDVGQLGHTGNVEEKEYLVPKEIQYFSRKKVVSIFAGLNCSFAVDYTGNLYGWGENTNGMLGLAGDAMIFEPQVFENEIAPWVSNLDSQVIFGKNSRGHIFQC